MPFAVRLAVGKGREVGMELILFLHGVRGEALWEIGSLRLKNPLVKRSRELAITGTQASLGEIVIRSV